MGWRAGDGSRGVPPRRIEPSHVGARRPDSSGDTHVLTAVRPGLTAGARHERGQDHAKAPGNIRILSQRHKDTKKKKIYHAKLAKLAKEDEGVMVQSPAPAQ